MNCFCHRRGITVTSTNVVHETDQSLVANTSYDPTAQMVKELLDRMKKLEIESQEVKDPKPRQRPYSR